MEGPRRSKRESARKRKAEGEEPKIKEEKQPAKRRRLSAAAPVPPAKPTGPSRSVPADQPTSSLAKASRTTQTKPAKTSPPKRARSPSPEEDDYVPLALPFKDLKASRLGAGNKRALFKTAKQVIKAERYPEYRDPDKPNYLSITAPPSLFPKKKYCDITGFEASYRDPKTGLQYCTADVYQFIQSLPHAVVQEYLKLRKAEHKI